MRVAHFGGFDAANYGDQLFPLIFARHIATHADVVHVSPTGKASPWADAARSVSLDALRRSPGTIDAIVIGGGNLIYTGASPIREYDDGDLGANLAYPSLWLGAAELAAELGVPLVWNATGVRRAFSPMAAELVSFVASVSDLIAVRDSSSLSLLRAAGVTGAIDCVVDSGIGVGALWSDAALDEAYRALFVRHCRQVPARSVALHIKERYLTESLVSLARRLDCIAMSLEATPILLALGPCHGDDLLQQQLAEGMATAPMVVSTCDRLIDFAACIASANAYLGSSLHGAVTACAFDTPAVLVAVEAPDSYHKFSGFLRHVGHPTDLCRTWEETEKRLPSCSLQKRAPWRGRDEALASSNAHWKRLIATCTTPLSRIRCDEKSAELARLRKRLASVHDGLGILFGALIDQAHDAVGLLHQRSSFAVRHRPSVDVVVCVHNALEHVRACFESLLRTSQVEFRVIVIDDGSSAETADYLRSFVDAQPRWSLSRNDIAVRYTAAVNQGLSASTAHYVVLLNSDTIVSPRWLSKLIACGEASSAIGLVGPLSNAAGWQSVPVVRAADGDWMVNELPGGISVGSMAQLVDALAANSNPLVPMLNGFCLAIKRPVLDSIGHFDCEISPCGYAEEIDYCFRAADAGFSIAIADSAYVYHAKSQSYGNERRRELAKEGKERIHARYGRKRLDFARSALRDNQAMLMLRGRLSAVLAALQTPHVAPDRVP